MSTRLLVLSIIAALLPITPSAATGQSETSRVTSSAEANFGIIGPATQVAKLSIRQIPAGATVLTTCVGKACPFRSRSETYPSSEPEIALIGLFDQRKLTPGTFIEVRITAPNTIGKVFRWELRSGKEPKVTSRCLPPGASKPVAC